MGNARFMGSLLLAAGLASAGCTTLRELPRSEYAARPERPRVRVETTEGLVYEFDYAQVGPDSLVGFRERDTEGPIHEIGTMSMPLDGIRTMSVRKVDWYRTGLVGGGALAAVVAAGLTAVHRGDNGNGGSSGGGKGLPGGQ
jgi:hypothetical protein